MSMSYCLSVTTKEEEDGNGNLKHFCQLLTADLKRLAINLIYTAPPAKLIGIARNVCFQFKPRKSAKSAVTLSLKLNKTNEKLPRNSNFEGELSLPKAVRPSNMEDKM